MAIKKSELYSSIWKSCDELRGGMDASQYKDYVLVLLFLKYVSDKYADRADALIEVPPGTRFADMVALKGDKEIGDKINKLIARLAEANDLTGVITLVDFNDPDKLGKGKEMIDRLSRLIDIFNAPGLNFSSNRADGDDLLGDAYEYLMRHFATESGKSKGQFYTPAEVSTIMAKVLGIGRSTSQAMTAHDPTCGSGSLLLKASAEAPNGLTLYGQEMDNATAALAKMNMILHDNPTAVIEKGNTLSSPQFKAPNGQLQTFDFVVANQPFSYKAWSNGLNPEADEYGRFELGIPPDKNGDYAFLLHILKVMKSTGRGAAILPHGVLFRGGAEGAIRKRILQRGYIKAVIGLPANLFYGTGIPACILVLDKEHAAAGKGVFFIDASKGYLKDGPKNRLRAQDIHKIVDIYTRQQELARYARMVPLAEIEGNDFNLNIPRYIDSSEPEDLQDIEAHLRGGIPMRDIDALAPYWAVFPGVRASLFEPADRPGYVQLKVNPADIKATVFDHPEFTAFNTRVTQLFARWRDSSAPTLKRITVGGHPKALIHMLGEDLLRTFADAPLIDAYDVYQHLMDYWETTMQDDVYQLVSDGWQAQVHDVAGRLQPNTDLLPIELVVRRYFASQAEAIGHMEAERDALTRQIEELDEEQGSDDGHLAEARNDKGKLTSKGVKERLKSIKGDSAADEERAALDACLVLMECETTASRRVKEAQKTLDGHVAARYLQLIEDQIKVIVVDDKWGYVLSSAVRMELYRVSQGLSGRVSELVERYASTMNLLSSDVEHFAAKVEQHLMKMGFSA